MHACGFDSVPSDLSVYALYRRACEDGAGELGDTTFVVRRLAGGVSGGTVASMTELLRAASGDPEIRRQLERPVHADPGPGGRARIRCPARLSVAARRAKSRRNWTAFGPRAFMMASANTRIVRRSNALLDWAYGARFDIRRVMSVGSLGAGAGRLGDRLGRWRSRRPALGSRYLDKVPSAWWTASLPSRAPARANAPASAATTRSRRTRRRRTARDIGPPCRSRATPATRPPRCCWARAVWRWRWTGTDLSDLRGVLTPAAAMGDALLARFPAAGVSLETSTG